MQTAAVQHLCHWTRLVGMKQPRPHFDLLHDMGPHPAASLSLNANDLT